MVMVLFFLLPIFAFYNLLLGFFFFRLVVYKKSFNSHSSPDNSTGNAAPIPIHFQRNLPVLSALLRLLQPADFPVHQRRQAVPLLSPDSESPAQVVFAHLTASAGVHAIFSFVQYAEKARKSGSRLLTISIGRRRICRRPFSMMIDSPDISGIKDD